MTKHCSIILEFAFINIPLILVKQKSFQVCGVFHNKRRYSNLKEKRKQYIEISKPCSYKGWNATIFEVCNYEFT